MTEHTMHFSCGGGSFRATAMLGGGTCEVLVAPVGEPQHHGATTEQAADMVLGALLRSGKFQSRFKAAPSGAGVQLALRTSGATDIDIEAVMQSIVSRWNAAKPAMRTISQLLLELERRGWHKRELCRAAGLSYPRLWTLMQDGGGWPRVKVFLRLNEWLEIHAPDLVPALSVLEMEARKALGGNFYRSGKGE